MKKRNISIFTLDAQEMSNFGPSSNWRFDLNSGLIRSRIVMGEEWYADSAFFDQMKLVLEADSGKPEDISNNLVYLKFPKGLNKENESLIENGFELRFRGSDEYIKFWPFDKSASMARNNTISFINKKIFAKMDQRLGLGIDWTSIELIPSKYYAYRGLYMTEGTRIDREIITLDQKKVLVLKNGPSGDFRINNVKVLSVNDEIKSKDNTIQVSHENIKYDTSLKTTPFDGEGLISPEYAQILRGNIEQKKGSRATSFQIRMPFSKGVLHEVDFKRFIQEQFPEESLEELMIEDVYGIKRKFSDIEIILTDSMFKCWKWLAPSSDVYETGVNGKTVCNWGKNLDPVEFFFDRMKEYDHALYIVKTNANFKKTKEIKLNYQFLNTLDLSTQAFEELVDSQKEKISELRTCPEAAREVLVGLVEEDDTNEEDFLNEDEYYEKELEPWEYALKENIAFLKDPVAKKALKDIERSLIDDIIRGKVCVDGMVKYLSGDLLSMLLFVAEKAGVNQDKIKELRDNHTLHSDKFYVASGSEHVLETDSYYGILRNPHLSRNEQCALQPYKDSLYNRYFDQLKGVVMISNRSAVAAALSGADFDGDIVKIVVDRTINQAILDAVYEKEVPQEGGTSRRNKFRRKLPIVSISSPKGSDRKVGRWISCNDARAVFSSRVGLISNLAIKIGKEEYNNHALPEESAALCTIATGLEIDSVKNGISPSLGYLEKLCQEADDGFLSAYKTFKSHMSDENEKGKAIYGRYNEKTEKYEAYLKSRKSGDKVLFEAAKETNGNVERLPRYFIDALIRREEGGNWNLAKETVGNRFVFETSENWREDVLNNPKNTEQIKQLEGVIGAYRKLLAETVRIKHMEPAKSLIANVVALLSVEYDMSRDVLQHSGCDLYSALNAAYLEVNDLFDSAAQTQDAINRLYSNQWQYVRSYGRRIKVLPEILGTDEIPMHVKELMCDTYDNGYQILYYILRDIKNIKQESENGERDITELLINRGKAETKRAYDEAFYNELVRLYDYHVPRSQWSKEAGDLCREKVKQLFNGDINKAIECTVALDKTADEKHSFLWSIFSVNDFEEVIAGERKKVKCDA